MVVFTFTVLFFLILRFTVTLFNFLSNPKLAAFRPAFTSLVSIIIVLKNEESKLLNLLDSIKQQDFNAYEVLIYHAGMDTQDEEILLQYCLQDPRFRMIHGDLNDYSWVEDQAKGDYLLLLDANTQINSGLINTLIYRLKVFKLAVISIIPSQIIKGLDQLIIFPLSDFMVLNIIPLRLIRLFKTPILATANNDCLLLDAKICFNNQWLDRIDSRKGTTELVKMAKQDQYKAEVLLGNAFVYKSVKFDRLLALKAAAENMRGYFNGNLVVGFIYVFLVVAGPLIILVGFDINVLILPFGLIFLSRLMISFLTAQNPIYNVLTHPLQMIMLVMVYLKAVSIQLLTRRKQKVR
jgi:glycosyltransferase involved in cell wall biosynthesis